MAPNPLLVETKFDKPKRKILILIVERNAPPPCQLVIDTPRVQDTMQWIFRTVCPYKMSLTCLGCEVGRRIIGETVIPFSPMGELAIIVIRC